MGSPRPRSTWVHRVSRRSPRSPLRLLWAPAHPSRWARRRRGPRARIRDNAPGSQEFTGDFHGNSPRKSSEIPKVESSMKIPRVSESPTVFFSVKKTRRSHQKAPLSRCFNTTNRIKGVHPNYKNIYIYIFFKHQ